MALNNLAYKLSLNIIPPLYSVLAAVLFATCRVREYHKHNFDHCRKDGPFIATVWHYSIFYTIYRMKGHNWVAMVSNSKDAEYIARLLDRFGYTTVRGSRSKGGLRAIREMIHHCNDGKNAAIIADGSQGPPRKVQAGAILLASKTGAPILPFTWAADRFYSFKSWDKTVLPLPFAQLALHYGEPITVPPKLKAAELEQYRLELENRLNELYRQAWACFNKQGHDKLRS